MVWIIGILFIIGNWLILSMLIDSFLSRIDKEPIKYGAFWILERTLWK
jgi:hypothetical protein